MDQEVIREGMRDVFGSFEDFHRNLSNVSNLTSIFGVVPNLPPPRHHMVNNGYHHGRNVASPQPSAKECIQRMTSDLIPNAPLLPLDKSLPAFNKSFLSGPPSSSSRSTPEQNDQKRTAIKRKTKTDSDSEVERGRDRRKKTKEALPIDNKPGTSQGSKPSGARGDDQMRELFGDDEKDCLKAISPDSGVHSTENELLDDTQSILNMFTKVSSPLSPLPLDKGLTAKAVKDRMGKENKEKREKEEAESRRIAQEQKEKDRERARKEQEEKDRRRKENERRERKEAERREAERKADEAKKAAEQRRLEEEAEAQKAAEARRVAEEEEKSRLAAEEEERSRKAAETERRRLAAEEERKKAEEAAEDERRKLKDMERKKKEERKRKEDEEARLKEKKRDKERAATATPDLSSQFGLERLKGELSLKTLSPNKMKQLEDMGRTNGRIMSVKQEKIDVLQKTVPSTKELHNNPSKDSTSRSKQDKGEKKKSEKDRGSEKADKDRKKDKKSKVAVIKAEGTSASLDSSPRPSSAAAQTPPSTSNGREFRCACHECTPTKRVYFEMPTDGNNATHYIELAKSKKRSADQEPDQLLKMIMYIESAVYFALSSLSSPDQYNLIKDLCEMIKFATNRFISKDLLTPLMQHLAHRTRSLSLRVQASLAYTMYQSKVNYVWKYNHNVDAYKDYRPVRLPAGDKPNDDDVSGAAAVQQSPASSVHSSSNSGASRMVSIPEDLFINQKQELKLAAHLMYAHRLWGDSVVISGRSETDMNFFNCLESVCGHLCVNTPVKKMAIFVITGITWLRKEYELEKQRPQPPGESKRLSSGSSNSQHS